MNNEELKDSFRNRDRSYRILSVDGNVRVAFVRNTNTINTAQKKHNLSYIPALYLSKTLTAAALVSTFLKGEERVVIDVKGDGLLSHIYAEVMHIGECRGYVSYDDEKGFSEIDIDKFSGILGNGTFSVSRILYNNTEPIIGVVPLQKGNIDSEINFYFRQSEQILSHIILDQVFSKQSNMTYSTVMLIQAMPGADENDVANKIATINENLSGRMSIEALKFSSVEEFLKEYLPFEFQVLGTKSIDFFCRCNIENFKTKLMQFNVDELKEMRDSNQNELVCSFCGEKYHLTDTDFEQLISRNIVRNN